MDTFYARKNIIITGGSSGIGLGLAEKLTELGADVYVLDVKTMEKNIPNVKLVKTDISNETEVLNAVNQLPNIDVLINNAGVMRRGTIFQTSATEYDLLMDVNVKGAWLMTKACITKLSPNAIVVMTSSVHAIDPVIDPGIYSLSKIALAGLGHLIEMTSTNIIVKFLYPGPVNTQLAKFGVDEKTLEEKMKKMISIEEISMLIAKFIQSDSKTLAYVAKNNTYLTY